MGISLYRTMDAVGWVNENVDFEKLVNNVKMSLHHASQVEENFESVVELLVDSNWGHRQYQPLCEMLGIELLPDGATWEQAEEDQDFTEGVWWEIDHLTEDVATVLTNSLADQLKGHFYFGTMEGDGSYALFYSENSIECDICGKERPESLVDEYGICSECVIEVVEGE